MSNQSVIINLPENVYEQYKRRAEHTQRTVEAEMAQTLTKDVSDSDDEELSPELQKLVNQLSFLDVKSLTRIAHSTLAKKDAAKIDSLHYKQQSEGLNDQEKQTLDELMNKFNRWFVLRNEAIGLLVKLGRYDAKNSS